MSLIKLKLGLMKIFALALFFSFSLQALYTHYVAKSDGINITKNKNYKGKDLEPVFYITCFDQPKKKKRYFEVIKTDFLLKNYFLAEYLLIEKNNSSNVLYYPFAWLSDNIKESDIRFNCQEIIKGNAKAVTPY